VEHGPRQSLRLLRVAVRQPVEGARWSNGSKGKRVGQAKRNAEKPGRAREIVTVVIAPQRLLDQRFLLCRLEGRTKQERPPCFAAMPSIRVEAR